MLRKYLMLKMGRSLVLSLYDEPDRFHFKILEVETTADALYIKGVDGDGMNRRINIFDIEGIEEHDGKTKRITSIIESV